MFNELDRARLEAASKLPPQVSVVVPIHNRFEHLRACLASLRAQTLASIEILAVDDHSDPETKAFIAQAAKLDPRIRVFDNQGVRGANAARNLGLKQARAEFVLFLDSDDMLAPFCLERRVADLRAKPELDFIAYPCLLFRHCPMDRLVIWNVKNDVDLLTRFLRHDSPFQTSGPLWRRASIIGRVAWDEDLPGWQDWAFHIEALLKGLKGELHTRIDYFWNEPKANSITKFSHDTEGRALRMQAVVRIARSAPEALQPAILSSVITLGVRIRRRDPLRAAALVRANLAGWPQAFAAAAFVLLEPLRRAPFLWLRGFFRKRVYAAYPNVPAILHDSNTYKLIAPEAQLAELSTALPEYLKCGLYPR